MRGPKTSLTLVSITRTSDGMGGWTESESNVATIEGYLRTLSGRERLASDMETVVRTHRFYCDYNSNITEDKRFKLGSKYFDIEAINNIGNMNIYMQIDLKVRE